MGRLARHGIAAMACVRHVMPFVCGGRYIPTGSPWRALWTHVRRQHVVCCKCFRVDNVECWKCYICPLLYYSFNIFFIFF